MEQMPKLPGYSFKDPSKTAFHRQQSLGYMNGYPMRNAPKSGIGGEPLKAKSISDAADKNLPEHPEYVYEIGARTTKTLSAAGPRSAAAYRAGPGQISQLVPQTQFLPAHFVFDKKVLKFNAYFTETVVEAAEETMRIRPVNIYYYLEDDSIVVNEPTVINSGIPQGKLLKRQKIPKLDDGTPWHWKDFNIGINVVFYGKVFHIVDCDAWTKEFMASEGIELNDPELMPDDPYTTERAKKTAIANYKTPSTFDKTRQFLELDRKVLRFFCVWDDRDNMFGEVRPCVLHYYLVDDTVEIREQHSANNGRDPFPVLMRRQKLAKNRGKLPSSFPTIAMEVTDSDISEWYTPKDFRIGDSLVIYGRKFLICDCDAYTRDFYKAHFGMADFTTIDREKIIGQEKRVVKKEVPPYTGFGSVEDSLQSCLSLIPQPPKKDVIKMLQNDHNVLRYAAILDTVKPEDKNRRFVISYRLADDMVTIYEPPVRNSGILGGKFLERTRLQKPGSSVESPEYYGPQDFDIGSIIIVFNNRFKIVDVDEYVVKYVEQHKDKFPASLLLSLKAHLEKQGPHSQAPAAYKKDDDAQRLLNRVQKMLQQWCSMQTDALRREFLNADNYRYKSGYIEKNELKVLCRRANIPLDDDILDLVIAQCTDYDDNLVNFEKFQQFFIPAE